MPYTTTTTRRTLFVWDFDWTIVNCNSDEYIPAQFITDDGELQRGFQEEFDALPEAQSNDWHACVEAMVGRAIHDKGATKETLLQAARQMPYLTSVKEALEEIHSRRGATTEDATGQMILSDGNTLFIGAFLQEHDMVDYFTHGIVSNQGMWSSSRSSSSSSSSSSSGGDNGDNGENNDKAGDTTTDRSTTEDDTVPPRLCVVHHSKPLGGHNCLRCPSNLCKTQALTNVLKKWFVSDGITTDIGNEANAAQGRSRTKQDQQRPRIVYVGDGSNDACPVLNVLEEGDIMLARSGRRRAFANQRIGGETDEAASSSTTAAAAAVGNDDSDRVVVQEEEGGPLFGILPALHRAREEQIIPKCQVLEWRTGDELKQIVRNLLVEDA